MGRFILVFLGGGAGALMRYLAGIAVLQRYRGHFPLGTVLINITGCFAIGLLMTLLAERWHSPEYWRLLLVVGFLGGYTTFSSFEYETYLAIRGGHNAIALLNVCGSVIAGYVAVLLGVWIARPA